MGRPINKRYLGVVTPGDSESVNDPTFTAIVKVGTHAVSETGIILSQRSETLFVVNDALDGTGNTGSCRLVDKVFPEDDEMVIRGYVANASDADGVSSDPVNIRKLQNRTVIDFDNNRYDWEIQDDSTANILVLTPIA